MTARVEQDPRGGWIARDRFGVEYMEPGWRWNSRSVARAVVEEDKAFGDIGVEAFQRQIAERRLGPLSPTETEANDPA